METCELVWRVLLCCVCVLRVGLGTHSDIHRLALWIDGKEIEQFAGGF